MIHDVHGTDFWAKNIPFAFKLTPTNQITLTTLSALTFSPLSDNYMEDNLFIIKSVLEVKLSNYPDIRFFETEWVFLGQKGENINVQYFEITVSELGATNRGNLEQFKHSNELYYNYTYSCVTSYLTRQLKVTLHSRPLFIRSMCLGKSAHYVHSGHNDFTTHTKELHSYK